LKAFSGSFPSTTSTALTSIFPGLPPSIHGVIGFNMYVPDYGLVFNTLEMTPVVGYSSGLDLVDFFSESSFPWPPLLVDEGINVKTFTRRNLVDSGLSKLIHRRQDLVGYALASDMTVKVKRALEQPGPLLLIVYYGGIDALEHSYGPYSEEVSAELQLFENLLKSQLIEKLSVVTKQKTMLLITADHGVVETGQTRFLNEPPISNLFLIPPTGDMRSTYFFPKYGQQEPLREALENSLHGFSLIRSADLIEKGAFGPVKNLDRL
jgi:predicted AlkP superfamily pyrophosphatase or phosphodiesterase